MSIDEGVPQGVGWGEVGWGAVNGGSGVHGKVVDVACDGEHELDRQYIMSIWLWFGLLGFNASATARVISRR